MKVSPAAKTSVVRSREAAFTQGLEVSETGSRLIDEGHRAGDQKHKNLIFDPQPIPEVLEYRRAKDLYATEILTRAETILVVDDDDLVRELMLLILQRQGYTILAVSQASQAITLCQSHPTQIDLLITDLRIPGGMDGRQLAERANQIRPEMKAILMSGYTPDALIRYGVEEGGPFLQKPFTQRQLAGKVREVLDRHCSTLASN